MILHEKSINKAAVELLTMYSRQHSPIHQWE